MLDLALGKHSAFRGHFIWLKVYIVVIHCIASVAPFIGNSFRRVSTRYGRRFREGVSKATTVSTRCLSFECKHKEIAEKNEWLQWSMCTQKRSQSGRSRELPSEKRSPYRTHSSLTQRPGIAMARRLFLLCGRCRRETKEAHRF